jgi:hypothetical protein
LRIVISKVISRGGGSVANIDIVIIIAGTVIKVTIKVTVQGTGNVIISRLLL